MSKWHLLIIEGQTPDNARMSAQNFVQALDTTYRESNASQSGYVYHQKSHYGFFLYLIPPHVADKTQIVLQSYGSATSIQLKILDMEPSLEGFVRREL